MAEPSQKEKVLNEFLAKARSSRNRSAVPAKLNDGDQQARQGRRQKGASSGVKAHHSDYEAIPRRQTQRQTHAQTTTELQRAPERHRQHYSSKKPNWNLVGQDQRRSGGLDERRRNGSTREQRGCGPPETLRKNGSFEKGLRGAGAEHKSNDDKTKPGSAGNNVWRTRTELLNDLTPSTSQEEADMLEKAIQLSIKETSEFSVYGDCGATTDSTYDAHCTSTENQQESRGAICLDLLHDFPALRTSNHSPRPDEREMFAGECDDASDSVENVLDLVKCNDDTATLGVDDFNKRDMGKTRLAEQNIELNENGSGDRSIQKLRVYNGARPKTSLYQTNPVRFTNPSHEEKDDKQDINKTTDVTENGPIRNLMSTRKATHQRIAGGSVPGVEIKSDNMLENGKRQDYSNGDAVVGFAPAKGNYMISAASLSSFSDSVSPRFSGNIWSDDANIKKVSEWESDNQKTNELTKVTPSHGSITKIENSPQNVTQLSAKSDMSALSQGSGLKDDFFNQHPFIDLQFLDSTDESIMSPVKDPSNLNVVRGSHGNGEPMKSVHQDQEFQSICDKFGIVTEQSEQNYIEVSCLAKTGAVETDSRGSEESYDTCPSTGTAAETQSQGSNPESDNLIFHENLITRERNGQVNTLGECPRTSSPEHEAEHARDTCNDIESKDSQGCKSTNELIPTEMNNNQPHTPLMPPFMYPGHTMPYVLVPGYPGYVYAMHGYQQPSGVQDINKSVFADGSTDSTCTSPNTVQAAGRDVMTSEPPVEEQSRNDGPQSGAYVQTMPYPMPVGMMVPPPPGVTFPRVSSQSQVAPPGQYGGVPPMAMPRAFMPHMPFHGYVPMPANQGAGPVPRGSLPFRTPPPRIPQLVAAPFGNTPHRHLPPVPDRNLLRAPQISVSRASAMGVHGTPAIASSFSPTTGTNMSGTVVGGIGAPGKDGAVAVGKSEAHVMVARNEPNTDTRNAPAMTEQREPALNMSGAPAMNGPRAPAMCFPGASVTGAPPAPPMCMPFPHQQLAMMHMIQQQQYLAYLNHMRQSGQFPNQFSQQNIAQMNETIPEENCASQNNCINSVEPKQNQDTRGDFGEVTCAKSIKEPDDCRKISAERKEKCPRGVQCEEMDTCAYYHPAWQLGRVFNRRSRRRGNSGGNDG